MAWRTWLGVLIVALGVGLATDRAGAVFADPPLEDPALEARAVALMHGLRCLVCQNQSIDNSAAPLARDLRMILRERIAAGDSDAQAIDYMVARYGDWVLMNPPFKIETLLLWLGPAILFVAAAGGVFLFVRRQARRGAAARPVPLSAEEEGRLAELLADQDEA